MLYTYSNGTQAVAVDTAIALNTNSIQTGCTVTHLPGSSVINLNKPGYYEVHFNADVTSDAAGDVNIQMQNNSVDVISAEATTTLVAGATSNLGFTILIRVLPNCCAVMDNIPYALSFVNTGIAATYTNVAVTITKVA